mgnify:CR=1 FL=1
MTVRKEFTLIYGITIGNSTVKIANKIILDVFDNPDCQNLIFPSGWSIFSTYIITDEMNMVNILDPIHENILVCKNNNGVVIGSELQNISIGNESGVAADTIKMI